MTVKELIKELQKYPDNYTISIREHWDLDRLRDTGKCYLSLESESLNEQFKYYEEKLDELHKYYDVFEIMENVKEEE